MALLKVILPHQRGDRFLFAGDLYEADDALLPALLQPDDQFLAPLFEVLSREEKAPAKAAPVKPVKQEEQSVEAPEQEEQSVEAPDAEPAVRPKKKQ